MGSCHVPRRPSGLPLVVCLTGLTALVAAGCCFQTFPVHRSDVDGCEASDAETILERHGITRALVKEAARDKWGIGVVTVRRVDVSPMANFRGDPDPRQRFVRYYISAAKVYRPGEHWGRPLLPTEWFVHCPDHWREPVKELLRDGETYLVLLEPHFLGKWPMLERAVQVSGPEDPLAGQVTAWIK